MLLSLWLLAAPVQGEEVLDLTVAEAVKLGLRRNLAVKSASYGPPLAEAAVLNAKGAFDPVVTWEIARTGFATGSTVPGIIGDQRDLTGTVSLSHRAGSGLVYALEHNYLGQSFDFGPNRESFNRRGDTNLSLALPLLRGFGADINRAPIVLALNVQEQEMLAFKEQLLDTVFQVESAYWNLRQARMLRSVRENALKRSQEFLKLLQDGIDEGVLAPFEAFEAAQNVEQRRGDLEAAERDTYLAERNLLRLLRGDLATDRVTVRGVLAPSLKPPKLQQAVERALRERPELERARLVIEGFEVERKLAKNALLPQLDLVSEYRLTTVRQDLYRWRVGLNFSVPLGNRQAKAGLRSAELALERSLVDLEDTYQQVILEVANSLRSVENNSRQVAAASSARKHAQARVDAELARFRAGLTSAHLVNFAEQQLINVEQLEVLALSSYRQSALSLKRALGSTLEEYDIELATTLEDAQKVEL